MPRNGKTPLPLRMPAPVCPFCLKLTSRMSLLCLSLSAAVLAARLELARRATPGLGSHYFESRVGLRDGWRLRRKYKSQPSGKKPDSVPRFVATWSFTLGYSHLCRKMRGRAQLTTVDCSTTR